MRGLDGRRPSPFLLSSLNSNNSSGNPLPGSAPPTPRPHRPLLPAPRAGRRPRRSTTPFLEPRQPSPQPGAGNGGPRAPAPTRPAAVAVHSAGHSPSARELGGGKARVGGRGTPNSHPGKRPSSEPTEPQRLYLQGLSPARTLEKHFRGSGGGKGFGTGTAPGLELPGPPRWGGAGRSEVGRGGEGLGFSEGSRKSAPGLVANSFCPVAPRFPKLWLYPLPLFDMFHSGHLIVQRRKPGSQKI